MQATLQALWQWYFNMAIVPYIFPYMVPHTELAVPTSWFVFTWRSLVSFFAALMFCFPCLLAQAAVDVSEDAESRIHSLAMSLQEAAARGDAAAISAVRAEFEALAMADKDHDRLGRYRQYYLALADFRAGWIEREQGGVLLEQCLHGLDTALDASPDFVEGLVLQAACAGNLISSQPQRTLELSVLSQRAIQLARELEPDNPRAAFVEALSTLFMPQDFGGGPPAARRLFEDAVRRFEDGPARDPLVNWGEDEAYLWLGIALSITGEREQSIEALKRAAQLNPYDRWIAEYLMPKASAGESLGPIFGLE